MSFNYFIIKFCLVNAPDVFVIWAQSDDDDSYLIDEENRILGFSSLDNIKDFVGRNDHKIIPFDEKEFRNYKLLLSNGVTSFSIKETKDILLRNLSIEELEEDDYGLLMEVYNNISDYFFQIKSDENLLLRKNVNIQLFFDYYYYKYFWKQGEEFNDIKKKIQAFNYREFVEVFDKLINEFVVSIRSIDR